MPQQTYSTCGRKIIGKPEYDIKQNSKTMLIDKYISGRLEDSDLREFKIRVETDANFAREVKLRKEIYNTIGNDKKMALLKTLKNINHRRANSIFRINIYSRQVQAQAFAASIVVLLVVGASLLTNYTGNYHMSNIDIYNTHFIDDGSIISTRSEAKINNSLVEAGIRLYTNEKYTEAVTMFDSNPENIIARLYTGFSYMKLEQFDKAEKQFKYIINHSDNIFIDQAEWNLGLSYLANNKTNQASEVFAKIAAENGAYSTPASDIIKKLENK